MDLLNWRIPYMDNTHSSWPSLILIVLFRSKPRGGSSYSDIHDQEVLNSLSDRPWKEKEGRNANRRLLLNSPDPRVPILGTSGAKVTEWVSRQSLKRIMYCTLSAGLRVGILPGVSIVSIYPCVIPVEAYTILGGVQGGRFQNGLPFNKRSQKLCLEEDSNLHAL